MISRRYGHGIIRVLRIDKRLNKVVTKVWSSDDQGQACESLVRADGTQVEKRVVCAPAYGMTQCELLGLVERRILMQKLGYALHRSTDLVIT